MQLKKNPVKQAIREGRTVFGIYIAVPSPVMVELAGYAGFDFVRIDICHSAVPLHSMAAHCVRPKGSPCTRAPETMATIGTMIEDKPATLAGSMRTMENQATLPMSSGTRLTKLRRS